MSGMLVGAIDLDRGNDIDTKYLEVLPSMKGDNQCLIIMQRVTSLAILNEETHPINTVFHAKFSRILVDCMRGWKLSYETARCHP